MSQSQTPLTQSDIDEIIAKRFIEKSLGPGTLTTRLQAIGLILPRIDQEDEDKIDQLEPLVIELGKEWILKKGSKNSQIKILLACIHSDILRIYAPEQPYSNNTILKKIFTLMIESLDGIQTPDSEDYDFHFRVLESISTVQSYIVMNDLEDNNLLLLLTKMLFKITKEDTIKLALTHITDILCGIITDLQVIPEVFLQFILERLIEPFRSQNPTEYDLAATVIRRCINDLKLAIEEYIKNTITNIEHLYDNDDIKMDNEQSKEEIADRKKKKRKRDKQLKEERKQYRAKLNIITELGSISTEFLENSLIHLEECLQNEHLEIRELFVDMFASIFTQSSPGLAREWSNLFRIFLKRYDDVSVEIREFMANITCLLFQTQYNFIKDIQIFCVKRIEDFDERIRKEITKQVCMASIQSSSNDPNSIISVLLFKKLLQRTLDKKQSVRYTAIEYISKLFGEHINPYWRSNKSLPSEMRALLPIPKQLVLILNSVDFNTKLYLENVFDREMIGNKQLVVKKQNIKEKMNKKVVDVERCIEERMNVILGIIALVPDTSKRMFQKYFMREKYQLQALINKILMTYNELRMAKSNNNIDIMEEDDDDDGEEGHDVDMKENDNDNEHNKNKKLDVDNGGNIVALERQYEISYSNFNQRFPIYGSGRGGSPKSKTQKCKPSDYLRQLVESPNSKIRHYLQNLCSNSTKLKSIYNCNTNLLGFVNASGSKNTKKSEKDKLNEFTRMLCTRVSNVLFSSDSIPILLRKMVDIIENNAGQPRALLTSGMYILNCLCDEIPNIFDENECLNELIKLLNFPKMNNMNNEITRKLSFVSLKILAKSLTPNSFGDDGIDNDFINDLILKSKISKSYEEAQLATECIIKCSGKYSNIIKILCDELSYELDISETHLPTLLSTLSIIAKLSPNIFITNANKIIEFILNTLLPYDLNENDGIYKENINIQNDTQQEEDDNDDEDDVETPIKGNKKNRRTRQRGRRKKKKPIKKKKKINKKVESSMTPILLHSKQCGIQILVNYLLSISDLPTDELGISSIGISPIGSKHNSPKDLKKRRNKNKNISDDNLNLEDVTMDDDTSDINNNETDVQIMEEPDPFNKDDIDNTISYPISPEIECDKILDSLFILIRKYGQINVNDIEAINLSPMKNTKKYSRNNNNNNNNNSEEIFAKKRIKKSEITTEEISLVNMSVDGILDIIRESRYRKLLGLLRFYELGFLIHHRNEIIRKHTLQIFWNKLRDYKLPTHYSCVFPLVATDPSKKLRDLYKPAVSKYFERMRKENEIRSLNININNNSYQISKLPEYLLFYIVHLLAHHPDFDEKLAKRELRDSESSSYKHKKSKQQPFIGWRGRRTGHNKSDESGYDTSPSRMIKKKKKINKNDKNDNDSDKGKEKKENDKEEADDMDVDENDIKQEEEKEIELVSVKKESPEATSCIDYFGTIFDFYFDALLAGSQSNQFPLIIKILTKIDESYDSFKPLSKGHRYLIRIAMKKLKKRYKGKSFQDFPGRVPLPKAIFKLRDNTANYNNNQNKNINRHKQSPRRINRITNKKKKKKDKKLNVLSDTLLHDGNQSLLGTTTATATVASDNNIIGSGGKKVKKKGIFTDVLKKKYGGLEKEKKDEENGSDHPSDDDIINEMDVGLDMSSIRRNLNESLIDKETDHGNEKKKSGNKMISSGSGADADDEVNSMIINEGIKKNKKGNIGRKRKRMDKDNDDDKDRDESDDNEDKEPPKKRPKRRVRRKE